MNYQKQRQASISERMSQGQARVVCVCVCVCMCMLGPKPLMGGGPNFLKKFHPVFIFPAWLSDHLWLHPIFLTMLIVFFYQRISILPPKELSAQMSSWRKCHSLLLNLFICSVCSFTGYVGSSSPRWLFSSCGAWASLVCSGFSCFGARSPGCIRLQ